MADIQVTRRARQDLLHIGRFTQGRWGIIQRRTYFRRLEERIRAAAENPGLGLQREELGEGIRSVRAGQHHIFYRETDEGILILRVLHAGMDFRRHIGD
jgi:toxin ParE1/3/4